jgi:hypothetical protein
MWTLERPAPPPRRPILSDTPVALIATLGVGWLAVAGLAAAGWLTPPELRVAAITAAHGGLLAVALAWGAADGGARLPRGSLLVTVGLIAAGATAAAADPRAAVTFLALPAWLAVLTRRGRLRGLGLAPRVPWRPVLVGVAVGALLGGHLLLSASQTLGYALRGGATAVLLFWTYDVGANVISAECFFRGALFNRLQRRWSFAAAATVATAAALLRYVVDPLLPKQVEVMAGALFYLTILGAIDCWLLWWSGSLLPGLLASWLFFLAYRALAIG